MERTMTKQFRPWPKVGDYVWVVKRHHTWDAHPDQCVTFRPVTARVLSVGTDTVHLEHETDRKLTEIFQTEEICRVNCPFVREDS